jgi:hypothetical protein
VRLRARDAKNHHDVITSEADDDVIQDLSLAVTTKRETTSSADLHLTPTPRRGGVSSDAITDCYVTGDVTQRLLYRSCRQASSQSSRFSKRLEP